LSAHFAPGAKLYLKVMMARYKTSVAPVREALAVLSGAGLVVSESQRGFRVAPASRVDFQDVAKMRIQMEVCALEQSIERGGDMWTAEMASIYEIFSRLSPTDSANKLITDAWESYHREFHFSLISCCGSPTLLNFCSQLHDRYDRYRRLALPSYIPGTVDSHGEIMSAAINRDSRNAVLRMRDHIETMSEFVLRQYRN